MENGGKTLGMEGPYLFNHNLVGETINQGFDSDIHIDYTENSLKTQPLETTNLC